MQQSNDILQEWQSLIDPFGIGKAWLEVQSGWMANPQAGIEAMAAWTAGNFALHSQALGRFAGASNDDEVPAEQHDSRFQDPIWTDNPLFDTLKEFYLFNTRWLEDAAYDAPDSSLQSREKVGFWLRQALNSAAPNNFLWSNPVALKRLFESGGWSAYEGLRNFLQDLCDGDISMVEGQKFAVGENLATSPGGVVFRNELLELIQYAPTTEQVRATPIVIVAPWINKYYILDLDERRSLVKYLTDQGFTVFITSWINPGSEQRHLTMDDYLLNGVAEAVNVAKEICAVPDVHLTGYCIGGTIVAAYMAWLNQAQVTNSNRSKVASWTLLTTLLDFAEPGEIGVFIDESSVRTIERYMATRGFLDGKDMATSFRLLRSNSLIWNYVVANYLLGETPAPLEVLAWNSDTTRMPEAMHSFYLREFYLRNRLIQPQALTLGGRPIDLGSIDQPLYAVGAEQDHIAPWTSTFRVNQLVASEVRYVLATSGHIMGIVNPPVEPPKRRYWVADATGATDPEKWREQVEKCPGSWWEDWVAWLSSRCGEMVAPPKLGGTDFPVLEPAPGSYVRES